MHECNPTSTQDELNMLTKLWIITKDKDLQVVVLAHDPHLRA
jgi:hypothetical protein